MKSNIIISMIIVCLLVGCASPVKEPTATVSYITLPPTYTLEPSPTESPTASPTITVTRTPKPTSTPRPTRTPTPTVQAYIGTLLPHPAQLITADNISQLALVAQWGKGSLWTVAFSPKGDSYAAASFFGVAIYEMDSLSETPIWIPFDEYAAYEKMYYSSDGDYLALETADTADPAETIYIHVTNRQIVEEPESVEWLYFYRDPQFPIEVIVTSPDSSKEFRGGHTVLDQEEYVATYGHERFSDEAAVREVYDTATNLLLYEFTDEPLYVSNDQGITPEACNITYFSACGNALMDRATTPQDAAFSNDGQYLAVRSASDGYSYSTLRLYEAQTGELISTIGSIDNTVVDFAFSPNSDRILVGFRSGTVHLWGIESGEFTFGAQHFNTPISDFSFSHDGSFLLIMRWGRLEVRSAQDGSLVASYNATAFALSPNEDYFAYGDQDGIIRMREIASGEIVHRFQGHTGEIFSLAFSDTGNFLVSSSEDCTTRLWNAFTGQYLHPMQATLVDCYDCNEGEVVMYVNYLEFLPDSPLIIGFGSFGDVVSWNRNSGRTQLIIEDNYIGNPVGFLPSAHLQQNTFGFDQENNQLIIDNTSYDLETGQITNSHSSSQLPPGGCNPHGAVSTDENLRFTRGSDNREGSICVLDNHTLELITTISVSPRLKWGFSKVTWPFISPDGTQLIVPTSDGLINVYQISN